MKPILHLNLKRKWYDMIESGEKKEEYREMSLYWCRIFRVDIKIKKVWYSPDDVIICFSNRYTKNRRQMFIKCTGLKVDYGKEEWGAENGQYYFVLSLGSKLKGGLWKNRLKKLS